MDCDGSRACVSGVPQVFDEHPSAPFSLQTSYSSMKADHFNVRLKTKLNMKANMKLTELTSAFGANFSIETGAAN